MRKILRQSHKPRNNQICLFLKGDKEEKKKQKKRERKCVCVSKRTKDQKKGQKGIYNDTFIYCILQDSKELLDLVE
jgi:hypothetical protein